ncbi:LOW QUALITY PROTEIN: Gag polyprotein [Plecturocebus cupreus]
MGQLESKEHKLFVHLLQSMIKSQGHDVKLNIIEQFVHIVREICPWVPEGGVLDEPAWHFGLNSEAVLPFSPFHTSFAATATPSPVALHRMLTSSGGSGGRVQQPTAAGASMPVALRSTASAPISPLTHALMSLHRGLSDSDNVVDNQGNPIRNYESIPLKTLKELKEAVAQYGPTAPYTISLIENLTISALPPTDWGRLTKACLSGGDYLLWRANYEGGAYEQAGVIADSKVLLLLTCFWEEFEPPAAQATLPTKLLLRLIPWPPCLATITIYRSFVSRLLQAIGRQVQDSEAGTLLVRQSLMKMLMRVSGYYKTMAKKGNLVDYIRLCADIGPLTNRDLLWLQLKLE